MKTKVAIGTVCCVLVSGLFTSCLKKKEFPKEPAITFNSFVELSNGQAELYVNFTDGDGDIGLNEGDTASPYNLGGQYYYNLFLDYYEKQNGTWVLRDDLAVPFYYRIPSLTSAGQVKALEGEIKVDMPSWYDPFSVHDTIKYKVRLVDRALNISNEVESDEIIIP